jgi:hypothetical protein
MHKDFVDWHAPLTLSPDAIQPDLWWQGVEQTVEALDHSNAIELVRGSLGLGFSSDKAKDVFWDRFCELDSKLVRSNALHARILCGAVLIQLLETAPRVELADLCGLAVQAASCYRTLNMDGMPPVRRAASEYMQRRSRRLRSLPSLPTQKAVAVVKHDGVAAAFAQNQLPAAAEPLTEALDGLSQSIQSLNEHTVDLADYCACALSIQAEATDALWWVVSSWSDALRQPVSALSAESAAFVLAADLYELTRFPVAPERSTAMLYHVLSRASDPKACATLKSVTETTSREWRDSMQSEVALPVPAAFLPCTCAIQESVRVPHGNDWGPAFQTRLGFAADVNTCALDTSVQFYTEHLLIRAMAEVSKSG